MKKKSKEEINVHHAESIDEAINDLHQFLEADMWYAIQNELNTEAKMCKYLQIHFDILRKEIKLLQKPGRRIRRLKW